MAKQWIGYMVAFLVGSFAIHLGAQTSPIGNLQGKVNANNALVVSLDPSGSAGVYAEDSAHTSGDGMVATGGVRTAACGTALSGSANDYNPFQFDSNGNLCINMATNGAGSATDTEDGAIAVDQANVALVASLNYHINTNGGWVRSVPSPCQNATALVSYPVDIVTAATTEVINSTGAGTKAYFCSINLVTAGANNVTIVEDDTDACASPTAGIFGGVTAGEGWNFAANGGIALGNGDGTIAKTATAERYVCIITSAATQLSGSITYALGP